MAEPLLPASLSRAREQKISELSQHFANDDLSLEDLERRIERVYKSASIAELDSITADLKALVIPSIAGSPTAGARDRLSRVARESVDVANPGVVTELPHSRMLAIMSSTRRVGRWAVPRDLRIVAMMSDTRLDLTTALLPVGGVVNIELTAVMASCRIIVSPGMHVINEMHSFMADVRSSADELAPDNLASAHTPVIRLSGTALMSDVKVKVRRREEPIEMDED
jgi:hypothetical protein